MDLDLLLAIGHHLAVFTLVGLFAAEFTLLRPGLSGKRITLLAKIDAAYGGVAALVIVVGVFRIFYGAVDPSYYWGNHAFWGKMAAFAVMGGLTFPATLSIRRWVRLGGGLERYVPPPADILSARRFIHLQAGVLILIPIFAAAMARGYGS